MARFAGTTGDPSHRSISRVASSELRVSGFGLTRNSQPETPKLKTRKLKTRQEGKMAKIERYEDIQGWQKARELTNFLQNHQTKSLFPRFWFEGPDSSSGNLGHVQYRRGF